MERKIGDKYTDKNGVERTLLSAADYNWNALTKSSKNYLGLTVLKEPFATKENGDTIELYQPDCKYLLYKGKRVKEIKDNETYSALASLPQDGRETSKISKTGISTLTACFLTTLRDIERDNGTIGKRVIHNVPKEYSTFVKYKLPNLVRLTANMFAERDENGYAVSDAAIKQPIEVKKTMARVIALVEKYPNVYPLLPMQLQSLSIVQDAFVEGKKQEQILTNVVRPDDKKLSGSFKDPQGNGYHRETLPGNQFFAKKLKQPNSSMKMYKFGQNTLSELNVQPNKLTNDLLGDELTKARTEVEQLSKQPIFEAKEKSSKDEYLENLVNSQKGEEPTKEVEQQPVVSETPEVDADYIEDIDEFGDIDDIDDDEYGEMPF